MSVRAGVVGAYAAAALGCAGGGSDAANDGNDAFVEASADAGAEADAWSDVDAGAEADADVDSGADAGPTPTLCAAPPGNLVAHSTFEEGMSGLAPTGWEVRNPSMPASCPGTPADHVFVSDASPSCGGHALSIDAQGTWDCYAIQIATDYHTITAGRTYRVSATVRAKGNAVNPAAWFVVGLQWIDASDAFFGDVKNPKTTELDFDWKVLSFDVVAPANATRALVWLSAHYPGRVDYDDVSIVAVD